MMNDVKVDVLLESYVEKISDDKLLVKVELGEYKLWTPDEPQLYFINLHYGKDSFST